MHAPTKSADLITDLNAVREFLITGREIPRGDRTARPSPRGQIAVPVHNGIVRVRSRASAKA